MKCSLLNGMETSYLKTAHVIKHFFEDFDHSGKTLLEISG